ncbi:MAG: hypothetical protein HN337_06030 [Deltaproteobacteria bacterium]|nr:hypothetical protein [Deltaproteobacteria bacterium]
MKTNIIIASLLALFISGCGAAAPVPPSSIPTAVEYAGEKINGQVIAQWGEDLLFTADADASDVVVTFTDGATGEEITDGSYGTATIEGENITITAPDSWVPNALSQINVDFTLPASASISLGLSKDDTSRNLGSDELRTTIDPLNEERIGELTFESVPFKTEAGEPDMDVYRGGLYACYQSPEDTGSIYLATADWEIENIREYDAAFEGGDYVDCMVRASNDRVAIVTTYGSGSLTDPRGTHHVVKYLETGEAQFGSTIEINSNVTNADAIDAVFDENGVMHLVNTKNDSSNEIWACGATSCDSSMTIADGSANGESGSKIAYLGDGIFHVVFTDNRANGSAYRDVRLAVIQYDSGSGYTLVGDYKVAGTESSLEYAIGPSVIIDSDGNSIVTWVYINQTTITSTVHMTKFDSATKTSGEVKELTGVDPELLPVASATFIDPRNTIRALINYYGTYPDFDDGGVISSIGTYDGEMVDSDDIQIPNFSVTDTFIRHGSSQVGRAYIIFTDGSDIYIAKEVE